jgi:hypothetical protein
MMNIIKTIAASTHPAGGGSSIPLRSREILRPMRTSTASHVSMRERVLPLMIVADDVLHLSDVSAQFDV